MFDTDGNILVRSSAACQPDLVALDLENGYSVTKPDVTGSLPLPFAVSGDGPDCAAVVEMLLEHGADPNQVSSLYGLPALGDAVMAHAAIDVFDALLAGGADPCFNRFDPERPSAGGLVALAEAEGYEEAAVLLGFAAGEC